jgi:hypothetical protein
MTLFGWLKGRLSHRDRATTLYKRGMACAKLHENHAALANYSAVIEMADAPADIRAMALYNRSVVHTANHDLAQASRDLEQLLEMPAAAKVKTEARRKLLRMQRTSERTDEPPSRHQT